MFVVFSLFFWGIIIPIAQLVGVYLPSTIINMLQGGYSFKDICLIVISMQLILMFQPVYEDIFNMFCKNRMLPQIDAQLKFNAYRKAINTDYRYIDDPEYFDSYTWAVSEYATKAADAQNMVNRMVSSIITIISMLSIIATLSPIAVIVTIVGTIVENIMHILTNYYDVKKDTEIIPYDRKLNYYHRVFYTNNYAADLKSTNIKDYLFAGYNAAQDGKINVIKKFAFKMIPWALTGTFTFYIARTFVILNIAHGIYTGNIATVGSYITMMGAVETLKNALNEMFYYVKDANRLSMYAKRIKNFFDLKSYIETEKNAGIMTPTGAFKISFNNISFNYQNSNFQINHLNLKINPGEKIAIVGENGVGKSTIVKLLMRFYDVNKGSICINDVDIRNYDINDLRRRIGVAFQNTNVYAMSFADNLCIYDNSDEKKVHDIIMRADLKNVLIKNNASIHTNVTKEFDEGGIMLSGGEIQKIGIARLLSGDFGLLIFDEPSAALDPIAEYEMTKLIFDSSNLSTTIIIAHRLSTIRNADRIYLIGDGGVKEVGTHDELISLRGKYYEMFSKQAENYR